MCVIIKFTITQVRNHWVREQRIRRLGQLNKAPQTVAVVQVMKERTHLQMT